jgi:ABC-type branched-subunit amino acid transport system ATPase component
MTAALEFSDVWLSYGPDAEILRGVNFSVAKGEIALLFGENGAGKTTIFDVVSGVRGIDNGAVRINGVAIAGNAPDVIARSGVYRMHQFPMVFASLPVRDNVLIGLDPKLYSWPVPWPFQRKREELWQKAREFADPLFAACPFLKSPATLVGELSFGQQRIVDFLRALVSSKTNSLLLLDEPFAGIHVDVAEAMWSLIRRQSGRGLSVVMIEHENEVARYQGLRRMKLAGGKI